MSAELREQIKHIPIPATKALKETILALVPERHREVVKARFGRGILMKDAEAFLAELRDARRAETKMRERAKGAAVEALEVAHRASAEALVVRQLSDARRAEAQARIDYWMEQRRFAERAAQRMREAEADGSGGWGRAETMEEVVARQERSGGRRWRR
jgi:hypothetical protein